MSNLDKFKMLMIMSSLPVNNSIEIGNTGCLDTSVSSCSFTGADQDGCMFMNLVVDAVEFIDGVMQPSQRAVFIVFQRYFTDPQVFNIGTKSLVLNLNSHIMLYDSEGTFSFSKLHALLSGKIVILQDKIAVDGQYVPDQHNWTEITLVRGTAKDIDSIPVVEPVVVNRKTSEPKTATVDPATTETPVKKKFYQNLKITKGAVVACAAVVVVAVGVGYLAYKNA